MYPGIDRAVDSGSDNACVLSEPSEPSEPFVVHKYTITSVDWPGLSPVLISGRRLMRNHNWPQDCPMKPVRIIMKLSLVYQNEHSQSAWSFPARMTKTLVVIGAMGSHQPLPIPKTVMVDPRSYSQPSIRLSGRIRQLWRRCCQCRPQRCQIPQSSFQQRQLHLCLHRLRRHRLKSQSDGQISNWQAGSSHWRGSDRITARQEHRWCCGVYT